MSYLLRRPRRNFIRIGNLILSWRRRRLVVTSGGIPLPNPPQSSGRLKRTYVSETYLNTLKVVFDNRPTDVVLDDLRKKECR